MPCPVALSRPSEPPHSSVLPVTTPRVLSRSCAVTLFMYVSIIQTMVWAFVFTSGAGMSYSGPMLLPSAWVKRRVSRISSPREHCLGSNCTPPLPPPNGRWVSEHLKVIHVASALTSSMWTFWW